MRRSVLGWLVGILILSPLGGCGEPEAARFQGSEATWAELLAIAEAEAVKVEPGAVLVQAYASAPRLKREIQTLVVRFRFVRSDGTQFFITFDDTNPESTLVIETIEQDVPTLTLTETEAIKQAVKRVQITPAQVLERTWEEGQAFVQGDQLAHAPELALEFESISAIQNPNPLWSIYYSASRDALTLWVDAVTGEVVHRETSHFHD